MDQTEWMIASEIFRVNDIHCDQLNAFCLSSWYEYFCIDDIRCTLKSAKVSPDSYFAFVFRDRRATKAIVATLAHQAWWVRQACQVNVNFYWINDKRSTAFSFLIWFQCRSTRLSRNERRQRWSRRFRKLNCVFVFCLFFTMQLIWFSLLEVSKNATTTRRRNGRCTAHIIFAKSHATHRIRKLMNFLRKFQKYIYLLLCSSLDLQVLPGNKALLVHQVNAD